MILIPGAASTHQTISCIKKHCYGGYVGSSCTSIGSFSYGVMSRLEEGYGCCSEGEEAPPSTPNCCLLLGSSSDLASDNPQIMAEQHQDESNRTDQSTVNEAAGSSNSLKDHDDKGDDDHDHRDQGWLQLSIGGFTAAATFPRHNNNSTSNNDKQQQEEDNDDDDDQELLLDRRKSSPRGRGEMIELDLLPIGSMTTSSSSQQQQELRSYFGPNSMFHIGGPAEFRANNYYMNTSSNLFLQHPGGPGRGATISSPSFPPHQEINWPPNFIMPASRATLVRSTNLHPSSSSASLVMPPEGPYFTGPFPLHAGLSRVATTARPAGIDFRVIDPPPRRPHSGIWFMLQAAQHQANEPFLPQISKSFLRIKDGGMKIRLVIKYLVDKLNLESESEVEIRCRGQPVLPFISLQHVRDSIWCPSDVVTLLPDSSTTDQLMVLHYGRSA